MYLLCTDLDHGGNWTLALQEFNGRELPKYAILSHTWEEDEVLFAHISDGTARSKKGFDKIRMAATQARRDALHYIWIDTCCINKSSSAELSEAINSMYTWYKTSERCYAFLADVPDDVKTSAAVSEFTKARWFTRGWTLQELLAPHHLAFYSANWVGIGDKILLSKIIAKITEIDIDILTNRQPLESVSVARRMSWAAFRQTTRVEDEAYCLMGLFSVNMPMLYGEGTRAFQRLQEEIMKRSDDHSLFAWVDLKAPEEYAHGLLANSTAVFAHSKDIVPYPDLDDDDPFEMTNKGLRVNLPLTRIDDSMFAAVLNCPIPNHPYKGFISIYLEKLGTGKRQYTRVKCSKLGALASKERSETVYVRQQDPDSSSQPVFPTEFFQLSRLSVVDSKTEYKVTEFANLELSELEMKYRPGNTSHAQEWMPLKAATSFKISRTPNSLCVALLVQREIDEESFFVLLGSDETSRTGCSAVPYEGQSVNLEHLQSYFQPEQPGARFDLEYHRVRIDMNPRVKAGVRLYQVNIGIEPIRKITPAVILEETVGVLTDPLPPMPKSWRRKIWRKG